MKKFISIILSICMLLSVTAGLDITALAKTDNGKCGSNLTWKFDASTGALTIRGNGDMENYYGFKYVPWYADYSKLIKSVEISSGVRSIGNYAFAHCEKLTSVNIPDTVTDIGDCAFGYCTALKSIVLPDSVQSIGEFAFDGCTALEKVNIPYGITELKSFAFRSCKSLKSIKIPSTVNTIGEGAFSCCDSLKSIKIPYGVERIGYRAFMSSTGIKNIELPDSVISIGESAFAGTSIDSIVIPDGVKRLNGFVFSGCKELSSVTLPSSVLVIAEGAFANCKSLRSIILPEGVQRIRTSAFEGCSNLLCITIPKSMAIIAHVAFEGCTSLSDIYYSGTEDDWNSINIEPDYNDYLRVAEKHYEPHLARAEVTEATLTADGKIEIVCEECNELLSSKTIVRPDTVTLSKTKYIYDGKEKKPSVKVTDREGRTISAGNYSVSYAKGRKSVGKYSVTIAFNGDYSGEKTLYFKISPKGTGISKLTAGSKRITVKLKKNTTQTTGYQIQYATSSKFTSPKSAYVKNTTTSKTIKSLKAKKKYYVRVRTYKTVNGTKYYSIWSKAKTITMKK